MHDDYNEIKSDDVPVCDMKLHFLGYGSGHNPAFGSNSAYIKLPGDGMLLLECGESTLRNILGVRYFYKIKYMTIILSHTHSDHSGSLGTLIPRVYSETGRPVNLLYGSRRQRREISGLLVNFGVPKSCYRLMPVSVTHKLNPYLRRELFGGALLVVDMERTQHVKELDCFSITIVQSGDSETATPLIYWSGDTSDPFGAVAALLMDKKSLVYHEANSGVGSQHMNIDEFDRILLAAARFDEKLAQKWRRRITLMHLDSDDTYAKAIHMGYNVPHLGK